MLYNKDLILTNLAAAHAILFNTPTETLNLAKYKQVTPCGTLHCAIGELSNHEYFAKQGVTLYKTSSFSALFPSETWVLKDKTTPEQDLSSRAEDGLAHVWLNHLFGPRAWARLFDSRANGEWDEELMDQLYEQNDFRIPTDKELALARIDRMVIEINDTL